MLQIQLCPCNVRKLSQPAHSQHGENTTRVQPTFPPQEPRGIAHKGSLGQVTPPALRGCLPIPTGFLRTHHTCEMAAALKYTICCKALAKPHIWLSSVTTPFSHSGKASYSPDHEKHENGLGISQEPDTRCTLGLLLPHLNF